MTEKPKKYRITAPICDFVRRYAASGAVRMHMPGHKGCGPLGCEALDITEITGADVLYEASGVIRESEENAARLFGTKATFYGTEGSSQMIRAMLYLAGQRARVNGAEGRITILAARNVHKSFVQACALLDYDVEWLYGEEESYLSCTITPDTLENALKKAHKTPAACFITSPDYLGKTADIRALAAVCRRFGVPLLVDNAHGAYLRFLAPSRHPMDLGADLCCDSAHKTLPVLTGGAYLHAADGEAAAFFAENAKSALALFGSTSPSYLILQSLDACNPYLEEAFGRKLEKTVSAVEKMKQALREAGMLAEDTEPLKITLSVPGCAFAEKLLQNGIACEFADPEHVVLMPGPENTDEELQHVFNVLSALAAEFRQDAASALLENPAGERTKKGPSAEAPKMKKLPEPERVMTIREAVFSPHETVPAEEAAGRIAGAPTVSCPPAVPIVVSGERISREAAEVMRYYGLEMVEVVK